MGRGAATLWGLSLLSHSEVVMEICARQPEANNRKDLGSKKCVRVDEGDSSRAQSQGQNMSSHQVEMIVASLNARCAEQEKKIGRQLMEFQHRFAKLLNLSEELIAGSNPRLSLLEDEIKDLRRELMELKNKIKVSRQSESQKAGVEEQVNVCSDPFMATPKFDASTPRSSTPTPSARHVIMAYAHISGVETDTTSGISPNETRKLLQTKGVIPKGHGRSWVQRIANKFVGRRKVHIPLNVNDNHWMAMVFNFDKEEIQIINSLKNQFDESKETALVEAIQTCMDEAVKDGLVTPAKPIKFTDWEVVRYDDIPQQNDGHSCAFFTLKYMLTWNGEVFTDKVEQSQIDIFSWKIVSSLLRSDCNSLRMETYKYPITAETYEAHVASQPMGSEDDGQEIIGAVECKMSDTSSSPKDPDTPSSPKKRRGRGRPRKLVDEVQAKKTKTMEELRVKFDSKTIAKQVASSMSRRSKTITSYIEPIQVNQMVV
uniref:Ubiquitin-like protease family profile domain-containing protein n=1 Tax=Aegilops tauschii TaxID=37682 RepID=M8BJW4_AEGTA